MAALGVRHARRRSRTRAALMLVGLVLTVLPISAGPAAAWAHPEDSNVGADPALDTGAFVAGSSGVAAPGVGPSPSEPASGVGPSLSEPASPAQAATVDRLFAGTRALAYLSMATLVGGLVFLAALWPAGADAASPLRLLWVAWALMVATSLAGIALAGVDRADFGLGHHLVDGSLIADTLDTRFGRAWAARLILAVPAIPLLCAISLHGWAAVTAVWWRVPAAAIGVGLVRAPGFVSNATFSEPAWLGSIVDLVHLSALSVWIGGLVMVVACLLPSRRADEIAAVLQRYSSVAFVSVLVVLTTGAMLAWQLVGSWASLFSSDYGQALVAKLALLATLLAVAQGSRRLVNQRLLLAVVPGSPAVRVAPFVMSVGAEVALASAVLGAAAVLVNLPPPS